MAKQTALAVYDRVNDPVSFSRDQATAVAALVAGTSVDQGQAIAMVCLCRGMDFMEFRDRYHWIPGKGPSMRADAMLAEFRINHGGKHEVLESSPFIAKVKFTSADGSEKTVQLTAKDCLLSRWPYGKDPGWRECNKTANQMFVAGKSEEEVWFALSEHFKDNWGTQLDWEAMLFARLGSSALRKICPEVNAGVYTPEEMDDVPSAAVNKPEPLTASEFMAADQTTPLVEGSVVEATVVTTEVTEASSDEAKPEPPASEEEPSRLTTSIMDLAQKAFGDRAPEALKAALTKRKVQSLRNLTNEQLVDLESNLRAAAANATGK